jgi:hypothetical protein
MYKNSKANFRQLAYISIPTLAVFLSACGGTSSSPGTSSGGGGGTTIPPSIYVASYESALWQCPISDGGVINGACNGLTNIIESTNSFICVQGVTLQTFNNINYAYVSDNQADVIWKCALDESGAFNSCIGLDSESSMAFYKPRGVTFKAFNGTMYAYVSGASGNGTSLMQCAMTESGSFSGPCVPQNNESDTDWDGTQNSAFQTFNGIPYLYVNSAQQLWKCPLTADGQVASTCTAYQIYPEDVGGTAGLSFASFNNTIYSYIGSEGVVVSQCTMNASGDVSGVCATTTNTPPFTGTIGVAIQAYAGNSYAYITDQSNTVWQCLIDNSTGAISNTCTAMINSNTGFNSTINVAFSAVLPN